MTHERLPVDSDAGSNDQSPSMKAKNRANARNSIVISSEEDSEDDAIILKTPQRSRRGPNVVDKSPSTALQSRLPKSPYFNSRQFLLGGSTGNAPIGRLRRHVTDTPTRAQKPGLPPKRATRFTTRPSSESTIKVRRSTRLGTQMNDDESEIRQAVSKSYTDPRKISRSAKTSVLEDDSDTIAVSQKTRQLGAAFEEQSISASETDTSEDEVFSAVKRKRLEHRTTNPPKSGTSHRDEDLQEDLEALQDTG